MPKYQIKYRATVRGTMTMEGEDDDEAFERAVAELYDNDHWFDLHDRSSIDLDIDVTGEEPTAVERRRTFKLVRKDP